ncbi:kinesin-like protein KIN-14I isoform X1 [Capsicum chacoense]
MALVSHMQSSKNGLSLLATIFNMVTKSTTSYETSPASFMDDSRLMEDLQEKQKQKSEMQKELDRLNDNLTFEKQKKWLIVIVIYSDLCAMKKMQSFRLL